MKEKIRSILRREGGEAKAWIIWDELLPGGEQTIEGGGVLVEKQEGPVEPDEFVRVKKTMERMRVAGELSYDPPLQDETIVTLVK